MTGWMVFADAAVAHADGTFSLVRAGIDGIDPQNIPHGQPRVMQGALFVRIVSSQNDIGNHQLRIILEDANGTVVPVLELPQMPFNFTAPGMVNTIVVSVAGVPIPPAGRYTFRALVDETEVARWPLEIR